MTTSHQTEPNANNALGNLLRGMMPGCEVRSEHTRTVIGYSGRHPDVLITGPGRAPVVVEAEYEPAPEAEKDARERLGLRIEGEARVIEAAIALRYPLPLERAYDIGRAVAEARLSYCVLHEDGARFPESGWLEGSVADLADLIRLVSIPQKEVEQAADTLERGIERAATVLDQMAELRPRVSTDIAGLLGMSNVPQTRRMACAILANALVFHERISGMHDDVRPLRLLGGPTDPNLQDAILAAWESILKINYYPIFAIAKDILMQLPSGESAEILDVLRPTAQQVNATGVDNAHDLTGRIFQRLIADRKYLATFYTRPASAALLASLAVAKLGGGVNWSDVDDVGELRVGDFACGTGALLSAVYEQIAARHQRAGGDTATLHPVMMEEVLYGCDVMPSAIHITGSTLSGIQPNVQFGNSRLYTMPYGRQKDGTVSIGSLELLGSSDVQTLFNTSDPALRTGSVGEETAAQVNVDIQDNSFDLVIMNPPFTRAGSDWEGDDREGDSIKQFRGLGTDQDTQKEMSSKLRRFTKATCSHGYAGLASAFAALGNRKLKPGGVLALVLPLSMAKGESWKKFRQMMTRDYTDLTVLSIAAADNDELSFSADTGMAEGLVIARKRRPADNVTHRGYFTSLANRPQGFVPASSIAKGIVTSDCPWSIEDGPYGSTPLFVGNEWSGEICGSPRDVWAGVRISDYSLTQTAHALADSKLWLPGKSEALEIVTVPLNLVGKRGFYHKAIAGDSSSAFNKTNYSPTSTYPCLWNHSAERETRVICEMDSQLQVRRGKETRATEVWATATRSHINLDFRFNSQPLAVAFTERASLGGRAWPNVGFEVSHFDYVFTLWENSTLGLLSFWWHSNRQQSGRGVTNHQCNRNPPCPRLPHPQRGTVGPGRGNL